MSLPLPTASDGYIVVAGHRISIELWNAVLPHIHARIVALEAVKADLETAVTTVTTDALALVADSVAPSLANVQDQIDSMNALLALAEDRLAAISSGGVVADNVTVQPVSGLEATNAQDAFEEIMGTVIDQIVDLIIPTKLSISAKADQAEAEAGTDNDAWMTPLRSKQQFDKFLPVDPFSARLLHVRDEKASGAIGQIGAVGWNTRDLNAVRTNEIAGASLTSNVVTLPAGTYFIEASAPAFSTPKHQLRLFNSTDGVVILVGTGEEIGGGQSISGRSIISGRFVLASSKGVRLDHYESVASILGRAISSGAGEVYTDCKIWKVA